MKEKVIYVVLAIVFIVAIVMTAVIGLRVDLNYAEANTITFTVGKTINVDEIKEIAKQVLGSNDILVQQVELFGDSAIIKTKQDITDENITNLCTKLNEKYEIELTTSDFTVNHLSNTKLRNVIEPYIIPIGLSTLLIVGFYAIRYRGTKNMIGLIKYLIIAEGLLYSLYAIGRVPVNEMTMPIALALYTLVVVVYSFKNEIELDLRKAKKDKDKPE